MELIIHKDILRTFFSSDFHSDFWKDGIKEFTKRVNVNEFDLFIFAGDTGEWVDPNCREIYRHVLSAGKPIIMVPGNHEFYHGNYQYVMSELGDFAEENPGFYFLERNYVDLPHQKIRIWGDTFWTDFRADQEAMNIARRYMNDYNQIMFSRPRGGVLLEPEDTVVLNDKAKTSLARAAADMPKDYALMVVTHHAPFPQSTPKQFRKPEYTDTAKLNKAYANDLYAWCRDVDVFPAMWIHGHIHDRVNYDIDIDRNIVHVASNPFGYPGEKNHDIILERSLELSNKGILVV